MQVLFLIITEQETRISGEIDCSLPQKISLPAFKKALLKNLQHGAPDPNLWLLQVEDTCDGGGTVKLHHAIIKRTSFLYILS